MNLVPLVLFRFHWISSSNSFLFNLRALRITLADFLFCVGGPHTEATNISTTATAWRTDFIALRL